MKKYVHFFQQIDVTHNRFDRQDVFDAVWDTILRKALFASFGDIKKACVLLDINKVQYVQICTELALPPILFAFEQGLDAVLLSSSWMQKPEVWTHSQYVLDALEKSDEIENLLKLIAKDRDAAIFALTTRLTKARHCKRENDKTIAVLLYLLLRCRTSPEGFSVRDAIVEQFDSDSFSYEFATYSYARFPDTPAYLKVKAAVARRLDTSNAEVILKSLLREKQAVDETVEEDSVGESEKKVLKSKESLVQSGGTLTSTNHSYVGKKLNPETARAVYALRENGITREDVADRFNVSRQTVSDIWAGRSWRSATGAART